MAKRIIASLVLFPLLALLIVLGGIYLQVALTVIILIAMWEVYHAFSRKPSGVSWIGYIFAIVYMYFADNLTESHVLFMLITVFTIITLMMSVFFHETITVKDCAVTIIGFFYVAILMSTIYLTRVSPYGKFFVWLSFIAAWGCDTGAYFTGMAIGKHKLVPKLSPKKTVEGAVGGIVLATLIALLYGWTVSRFSSIQDVNILGFCGVAGFVGSILSQFGDLTASAIKRFTGVKDYGKLIPGHGGIMDRFDSVLFTAPAIYIVMVAMIR